MPDRLTTHNHGGAMMFRWQWYDFLAHGVNVNARVSAREFMQSRLMQCGLSEQDSWELSWYSESHPEDYERLGR